MLATCNKCRTTREIKLRVDNPKNVKMNRNAMKDHPEVKVEPTCTQCGTVAKINTFAIQLMIDKHDFLEEEKAKVPKTKCHACQSNQIVKLDTKDNPRCMRCGGVVKLTQFMVKAMKTELHLVMDADELKKWELA